MPTEAPASVRRWPATSSMNPAMSRCCRMPPDRGEIREPQVPGLLRNDRGFLGVKELLDLLGTAQVPSGNHLRFPVHPGHFAEVTERFALDHFLVHGHAISHTLGHSH